MDQALGRNESEFRYNSTKRKVSLTMTQNPDVKKDTINNLKNIVVAV